MRRAIEQEGADPILAYPVPKAKVAAVQKALDRASNPPAPYPGAAMEAEHTERYPVRNPLAQLELTQRKDSTALWYPYILCDHYAIIRSLT